MLVSLFVIWGKEVLWKGQNENVIKTGASDRHPDSFEHKYCLTIITCETFTVFGSFKTSLMKYLSPIGVCFTTASNTEQSRERNCQWTPTYRSHLGDKGFRMESLEYWHQPGRQGSSGCESSPHGSGCFCSLAPCTSTSRTTCHTLLDGGLLLVGDWKSTSEFINT